MSEEKYLDSSKESGKTENGADKDKKSNKKNGGSLVGTFFSVFLRAIVVILALVIAVLGFVLVKQIVTNNRQKEEAVSEDLDRDELITATYKEEIETTAEAEEKETVNVNFEVPIVVLNGTDTAGLAAAWMDELKSKGYTSVMTGNYFDGSDATKILIKEGNAGAELVQYFEDAEVSTGVPDQDSTDAVVDDYTVFVIIGPDDVI